MKILKNIKYFEYTSGVFHDLFIAVATLNTIYLGIDKDRSNISFKDVCKMFDKGGLIKHLSRAKKVRSKDWVLISKLKAILKYDKKLIDTAYIVKSKMEDNPRYWENYYKKYYKIKFKGGKK
jgi:hypothetical protein